MNWTLKSTPITSAHMPPPGHPVSASGPGHWTSVSQLASAAASSLSACVSGLQPGDHDPAPERAGLVAATQWQWLSLTAVGRRGATECMGPNLPVSHAATLSAHIRTQVGEAGCLLHAAHNAAVHTATRRGDRVEAAGLAGRFNYTDTHPARGLPVRISLRTLSDRRGRVPATTVVLIESSDPPFPSDPAF